MLAEETFFSLLHSGRAWLSRISKFKDSRETYAVCHIAADEGREQRPSEEAVISPPRAPGYDDLNIVE